MTLWLSAGKVFAQVYPTSITNPTGTSTSLFPPASASDIDSVTIGATMPYYVLPDLNFNPSLQATATTYDVTKIFTSANISSTFSWTVPTGCSYAHVPNTGTYTDLVNLGNFMNITFTNSVSTSAVQTITVNETSSSTYGGCTGSTTFNVQVINAPTAQFSKIGVVVCPSETTISLPLTATSSVAGTTEKQLQFTFNYQYNGGTTTTISTDAVSYALGSGSVIPTVTLASLPEGIYTFTLTGVSDRISRKCNISGNVTAQPTFKVYVTSPKPTLSTSAVQ
jgi:hypothetical protein